LFVLKTDNEPRVSGTAFVVAFGGPICRKNVTTRARPCPPVPPLNLHGKERSTVRVRQRV
jgi:hypothetical protein